MKRPFHTFIKLRHPGLPHLAAFLCLVATPALRAQTPAPTVAQIPSASNLTVSPEEEIKILEAIDTQANTPSASAKPSPAASAATDQASTNPNATATPNLATANSPPPSTPVSLSVLVLKDGVYLSWAPAAPNSPVTGYNIFRSTIPGLGYKKINAVPVPQAYFLDGPKNSLSPPLNGEDYFYVVSSTDSLGRTSPYSDEIAVSPKGMEYAEAQATQAPTAVPTEELLVVPDKNVISLQLPADTQLSIQGYKKIQAQFNFQYFPNAAGNGQNQEQDTTTVNQELVVNLQGKVGKNVDVNVDYSDVNRAGGVNPAKQDISIAYHGDKDSPVQEVEFGDLQLLLPNTEFAGFNKNLFGLQAKMKFDQLRLTGFFAQTKGIAETKTFKGNSTQVDKTYLDINYIPFRYFLITRDSHPIPDPANPGQFLNGALPLPNTEQIWVDPGNNLAPLVGPNFIGFFEHWLPGRDYTMDYTTGVITFIRPLPSTARIAVAFQRRWDNAFIGFNGANIDIPSGTPSNLKVPDDGVITNAAHLIKDNNNTTGPSSASAIALSPLYLVNYFDLGRDKIVPPQQDPDFLFEVHSQSNNDLLQTGQGVTQAGSSTPWVYNVDLDLNVLTVTNSNFQAGTTTAPPAYFMERPFANLDGSLVTVGGSVSLVQAAGVTTNDVYSQTTPPSPLYLVHIKYKTQLSFFNMGRFDIIQGSEAVYLDGRRLRRDVDYLFDYTSGTLDFQDKSILRPDSEVVVSYEYAPFGSFSQNNILGARAEYDLADNFFLGSTFLESDAQQPIDVPQVGSTPNSLTLFDADARYDLGPDDLKSITGAIPGLENWRPPLSLKLSGEVAQSYFNPDTFNAEGETGVAMIDNMEGIDSVAGPNLNQTGWLVSSAPQSVAYLPVGPYAGPDNGPVTNNRCRFYNAGAPNGNMVIFQTIGTQNSGTLNYTNVPAYGGHVFANTGQPNDAVQVLQFPYSHLTTQRWAGLRQVISTTGADFSNVTFVQSWIYNDGNDKWIMVDFGVMNEDSNGNGSLDADPNYGTANPANPSYAIPTSYYSGNPWYLSGTNLINYLLPGEQNSQEGVSVGFGTNYVTEDMNANNSLDSLDAYYEYGIEANWTGWRQVKIPVNFNAVTTPPTSTPDGTTYFFNTVGASLANPSIIRTVRVWTTAGPTVPPGQEINGDFYIENLSFTHNLWQLQVDPTANANQGVTVNTAKFDVNSISQDQDGSYSPTLRFLTVQPGQDQSAILFKEKSLDLHYQLSSADFEPQGNVNGLPIYYATHIFTQGLDLTDYKNLRIDLNIRAYQPGDVLFVRVGNDQQNYYQYNIQLSAVASTCLDTWGTVIVPLDGSGGATIVGTPFVNRVTNISFGVVSPNPPSGNAGELWIDNLRATDSNVRSGLARRANAALLIGDAKNPFATLNGRYREVDSGFTQMDQTSTHFQHSAQIGADYASSGVSLFSQPLVTQVSYTHQDLTTEQADKDSNNPYFLLLPDSHTDNWTGSISYTKDLGPAFGRLTSVRLSGSSVHETDNYGQAAVTQPGAQGVTQKSEDIVTLASTYDAPPKLFFISIGANQFNETYSLTYDTQDFAVTDFASYHRVTQQQTYQWTNTTEVAKNLIFTPGFTLSLTDAYGNTNTAGAPVSTASYIGSWGSWQPFQQRYQPKAGLVYRGIPGIIPSVDYSGSNLLDYVSYQDGERFTSANTLNYSLNLTPGSWFSLFQKINLTMFGGLTESANSSIPHFEGLGPLTLGQQWLVDPDFKDSLTAGKTTSYQANASFKLFDVWDFRPTGSWTNQANVLSLNANAATQVGETLSLTTTYSKKLFTLPLGNFTLDSLQFQYTHTENTQWDTSNPPLIASEINTDLYGITLPYDINQKAQGNISLKWTTGSQQNSSTFNIPTNTEDDLYSIEYDQRFAPGLEIHIPFTRWKLQLHDAIDLKTTFSMEFVNDVPASANAYAASVQLQTQKYRGTVDFNYNALKNLRVGLGFAYENFTNQTNPLLSYILWQGSVSAEARF